MKTLAMLTMTEFRKEPGERIRDVSREGKVFVITKAGKPVAMLLPIDKMPRELREYLDALAKGRPT